MEDILFIAANSKYSVKIKGFFESIIGNSINGLPLHTATATAREITFINQNIFVMEHLNLSSKELELIKEYIGESLRVKASKNHASLMDRIRWHTYRNAFSQAQLNKDDDELRTPQEIGIEALVKMEKAIHQWATTPVLKQLPPSWPMFTKSQVNIIEDEIIRDMGIQDNTLSHRTGTATFRDIKQLRNRRNFLAAITTGILGVAIHEHQKDHQINQPLRDAKKALREEKEQLAEEQINTSNEIMSAPDTDKKWQTSQTKWQDLKNKIIDNAKQIEELNNRPEQNGHAIASIIASSLGGGLISATLINALLLSIKRDNIDSRNTSLDGIKNDDRDGNAMASLLYRAIMPSATEQEAKQRTQLIRLDEEYSTNVSQLLKSTVVQHLQSRNNHNH